MPIPEMQLLFASARLSDSLAETERQIQANIDRASRQQLDESMDAVVDSAIEMFVPTVPTLDPENTIKNADHDLGFITIAIPFQGSEILFSLVASRFRQPASHAEVGTDELCLHFDKNISEENLRSEVDNVRADINENLQWQREDCNAWVADLRTRITNHATQRLASMRGLEDKIDRLGWRRG